MGFVEIISTTPNQLDLCDACNQQGLKENGHSVIDFYGEVVLWFCFNCKAKILA